MATVQKQMQKPFNAVHGFMEEKQKVCVWMMHDNTIRIEGTIVGYDEFMNFVLEDATEVNTKTKQSEHVGKILLKGDNVGLVHAIGV